MERTLKSGVVVRTRVVPTHAIAQIGAQFAKPIPPKIPIKSVAGHTEMVTAPDDSPEWLAYVQASAEYDVNVDKAKADFIYDYAVEAWQNGDSEWQTEVPPDWIFPDVLSRHGLKPRERRADYVRYHLLVANEDVAAVLDDALGKSAPITNAEVDAALGGFQGDVQRRSSA